MWRYACEKDTADLRQTESAGRRLSVTAIKAAADFFPVRLRVCCILSGRASAFRRSVHVKPRLLFADDHPAILHRVATLLGDDFDVAGTASDGWQAIDLARQLDPDVIVLDINMPGLNGFQTSRALSDAGSKAPIVFLSALDADEHVGEAFRWGARGFVEKSYIARDLPSAIDHVLSGRQFLPSLTSMFRVANGRGHAIDLHDDAATFLNRVSGYFDLALKRGDATCVIADEETREGLSQRLRSRGWDLAGPSTHNRYLLVDAGAALQRFMRNGLPDPGVLADIATELDQYRLAVTGRQTSCLTLFGNMAGSLMADGNAAAAIALEHRWTAVTKDLPFLTLCGYAPSCFPAAAPTLWANACAEHAMVCHSGTAATTAFTRSGRRDGTA